MTTGALYHHFGSELGLYTFVRADVQRRPLARMEGALADRGNRARQTCRDAQSARGSDDPALGRLLAAAWRAALAAIADGAEVGQVRTPSERCDLHCSTGTELTAVHDSRQSTRDVTRPPVHRSAALGQLANRSIPC